MEYGWGNYAGPVTRDNVFFYGNPTGLHVTQDRQRYVRAEASHLYDLLTWVDKGPALTKKGAPRKRQPPPHKDESEAYYVAQSIHYGLKPSKTKDATKKALLDAFGGGKDIKVPGKIVALEKELRKLWLAENEKALVRLRQEEEERQKAEEEKRAEDRRRHEAILAEFEAGAASATKAAPSRKRKAVDDGKAAQKKAKTSNGSGGKVRLNSYPRAFLVYLTHIYSSQTWISRECSPLRLPISRSNGTKPLKTLH